MHSPPQKVHVIANPASARREPILKTLNDTLRPAGIYWQISVTHAAGEGTSLARQAIENGADLIAAYGGDGTIKDVAGALVGTDIPLLILPAGTGNLVATALDIPGGLGAIGRAARKITAKSFQTKAVDVGKMGDQYFLLRAGCGFETGVLQDASRDLKKQFGKWAYVFASVKALQEIPVAEYTITLDDKETMKGRGVACAVANAGILGIGKLTLSRSIDLDDGKLDVILLRTAHIDGILELARMIMGVEGENMQQAETEVEPNLDASDLVSHWQAQKVCIESDPVQDIQADGDLTAARTPQTIEVLPRALHIVV